jgi:phage virion morphogenesis protein
MFLRTDRNDLSPALSRMIAAVQPPQRRRILRAMGTTFKSITEGTFNSVGAEYRPTPWPAKKDGSPSNLQKSTTLAKSFNLDVGDDFARVSNPTPYAIRHQFGSRGYAAGQPTGAQVQARNASRRSAANANPVLEGSRGTPPRPFFPVLNGKLTPAAEEKIAGAAQRVLATIAAGGNPA